MGKLIDFNSKKLDKMRKKAKELETKLQEENDKLLQTIVEKGVYKLDLEEESVFKEIKVVCSFEYETFKGKHDMYLVLFRDNLYVLHDMRDGSFELVGTLTNLIDSHIGI